MAGRTDRWIFTEMAALHGVALNEGAYERLREAYVAHLVRELDRPTPDKRVLPGVRPLLDHLAERDDVTLGLLTGNAAAGARIKLEHFDLWRYFRGGGFGDEASERASLFAAAITAIATETGQTFSPDETIIVGDTPHDVAVARAVGSRCLAVATGGFGPDALVAAGAELVLQDFTDLSRALAALGVGLPLV